MPIAIPIHSFTEERRAHVVPVPRRIVVGSKWAHGLDHDRDIFEVSKVTKTRVTLKSPDGWLFSKYTWDVDVLRTNFMHLSDPPEVPCV